MPSFYNKDNFIRLIPFKDHVNIQAKGINDNLDLFTNYTITPTHMLQIKKNDVIPKESLIKVFKNTLMNESSFNLELELEKDNYNFLKYEEKQFIVLFSKEMMKLGYTYDNQIVDGICYGKYMMIFRKMNVKSKNVYARIYFRINGIVLRFYFDNISKHEAYINQSPDYIKNVFIGNFAKCNHCRGNECHFRKTYTINNIDYEKCNGLTFEFTQVNLIKLNSYIELFKEFY